MGNPLVPPTTVRPDDSGWPDDIVLDGVDVHLERMDDNSWWMGCYRGDKRICFWFSSREDIRVAVTEDEFGAVDDRECLEFRDGKFHKVREPVPFVQPDETVTEPEYHI